MTLSCWFASTLLDTFNMGQGPDVVAGLVTKFGVTKGTKLYFDNLFTSMKLLKWLSSKEIGGTGTVRSNRVIAMPHPHPKIIEKEDMGSSVTY